MMQIFNPKRKKWYLFCFVLFFFSGVDMLVYATHYPFWEKRSYYTCSIVWIFCSIVSLLFFLKARNRKTREA